MNDFDLRVTDRCNERVQHVLWITSRHHSDIYDCRSLIVGETLFVELLSRAPIEHVLV